MSETERFTGRRYEVVAFVHGEKPIYYEEFGREDANGMWLLVGKGASGFSVYRGEFGYCSFPGCGSNDAFDKAFGAIRFSEALKGGYTLVGPTQSAVTRPEATRFVREGGYQPFVVIPFDTMRTLCEERTVSQVLPANFRDASQWEDLSPTEEAAPAITTAVKLEMGWLLEMEDVLGVLNQELRSRALDVFGSERLVREAGAEAVDRDGENELLRVADMLFVHAKDASTPRRYLLRVPPRMQTVREAIAWTFGFTDPQDYRPAKET